MTFKRRNTYRLGIVAALCALFISGCGTSPKQPDPSQPVNGQDYPLMGMSAEFPASLQERMDRGDVNMLISEIGTTDGKQLQYGYLVWETTVDGNQKQVIGALGVYQNHLVQDLDELTGCDKHQKIGDSTDGGYQYYLSFNSQADSKLVDELRQIKINIREMADFSSNAASVQSSFSGSSLGNFTTQDIFGKTYTQDIFKDYELTMVNVFTTWCTPCVEEMPDLEKLHQQMASRDVQVIGVVLNVLDSNGNIVQSDLELAQTLAERTGVTYPILLPDIGYFNGRLTGIQAFPETFFVDRNGNVVSEAYSGSGSLEDWKAVVEQELKQLETSK